MSSDLMNYEQMTQLALRGVVRDAIRRVIREDGLPGAHHFYITFLTRYPGVEIDEGLARKYPDEITIVLEHQYWDLNAYPDEFEVTLKFGGIPKYLKIPYHAITRFHDPSASFALQFDPPAEMSAPETNLAKLTPVKSAPLKAVPQASDTPKKTRKKPKTAPKTTSATTSKTALGKPAKKSITKTSVKKGKPDKNTPKKEAEENVVSLDSFRKK